MAATTIAYASGTVTTSGTTWATTSNATGSTASTYATFTNAASGGVGTIRLPGYAAQTAMGGTAPASIDSVAVTVKFYVTTLARWSAASVQLYTGSTAIGSPTALTLSATTTNSQTVTLTGANAPSWADCSDLQVRVSFTHSGTTSDVANLDFVGVVVNYTPAPVIRYVDNSVGTSGTGVSWATAWKNLSNIDWPNVPPGSTVYLSGGTTSKTYSETLAPAASGTSTAPITVTRGVDAGHTGVPILDGGNTRTNCYDNGGYIGAAQNYITISGLRLQDATENPVWIRSSTGCVIDTCEPIGPDNATYSQAVFANQNTDFTVRRCTVTTVASTVGQADGIYLQDNLGTTLIEDNNITISNTDNTAHSDGIQTHQNGRTIIRRNVIYSSTAGADNHVMWLHAFTTGTTSEVYSNVFVSRGGQYNLTYWRDSVGAQDGTVLIYNNTIYGGARALNTERVANVEVKNNIIWPDTAGTAVYSALTDLTTTAVTFNIIWAPSGTIATTVAAGGRTYVQWTTTGYNASGYNADPLLVSPATDLHLQAGSPAINTGTTLALVATDLAGTTRPVGAAYDIGAYEATGPEPGRFLLAV